jgi:hypothetical protein
MKNFFKKLVNLVTVSDITYSNVNSIVQRNNELYIDGKLVDLKNQLVVNVIVEGDINEVSVTSGEVLCSGVIQKVKSTSGRVIVKGNIDGNVKTTSGKIITEGYIGGSVSTTSGNVTCSKSVNSIKTLSGDIKITN